MSLVSKNEGTVISTYGISFTQNTDSRSDLAIILTLGLTNGITFYMRCIFIRTKNFVMENIGNFSTLRDKKITKFSISSRQVSKNCFFKLSFCPHFCRVIAE